MGTKPKFWFRCDRQRWLFKEPRGSTGEHWAEKGAAEIGHLLGIPCARVELAEVQGNRYLVPGCSYHHARSLGRSGIRFAGSGRRWVLRGRVEAGYCLEKRACFLGLKSEPCGLFEAPFR
jgi:hypothetical protein